MVLTLPFHQEVLAKWEHINELHNEKREELSTAFDHLLEFEKVIILLVLKSSLIRFLSCTMFRKSDYLFELRITCNYNTS